VGTPVAAIGLDTDRNAPRNQVGRRLEGQEDDVRPAGREKRAGRRQLTLT